MRELRPQEWDELLAKNWLGRFSPPRPLPDPRMHGKSLFPPPELLSAWESAWETSICTGDLGLPVPLIHGDRVPAPRVTAR